MKTNSSQTDVCHATPFDDGFGNDLGSLDDTPLCNGHALWCFLYFAFGYETGRHYAVIPSDPY